MKESTSRLLLKSARAILAAKRLLDANDAEFACGRAYYAMFYIAAALLDSDGLKYRKHSGVHSALGEHFAKTGRLDAKYHRWLIAAFNKRIAGDYDVESYLTTEEVDELIQQAEEFLKEAETMLGRGD